MNDIDTRAAVRGLAEIVKTLAVYNRHLTGNLLALVSAIEATRPEICGAYISAAETPPVMPEVDALFRNIDALLQQLGTI